MKANFKGKGLFFLEKFKFCKNVKITIKLKIQPIY